MTKDEIIDLAERANIAYRDGDHIMPAIREDCDMTDQLIAFADAIIAHERNADFKEWATKVCELFAARRQ